MNDLLSWLSHIRPGVALVAGPVLACLVTLHVLLRKREVASAMGWIGFAWFAPLSGSLAYFMLGVNRVQRRARRLRQGGRPQQAGAMDRSAPIDHHLDALERGIRRITGRPVLAGNRIAVFHDGDEAYPAMLAAIGAAERSIGLSSYIFHDDVWGGRFIDALAAAHGRGIAVRVLIDGIGGGWLRSPAYHHLRRRGVPAARFLHSPLPWRMPFLNLRSHRKLLVLDGRVAFTGGMNISDLNVMASHPANPVQDTHFRVDGPLVCQLADAFAQDWAFAADEDLTGQAWFPDLPEGPGAAARVVDSGPDEDIEKIEFAMLQAVACARRSIAIMTPYFLPDDRLVAALSLAAMRGVAVDVVIPQKSDHRLVDWAAGANSGPLLADGVRIWRCPPPFRHSKAMTVDGLWCIVGSCNWDIRSFRLNFELCVESYDPELTAQLDALMVRCRGTAFSVAGRSVPVRLRDAGARLLLPYL
jgi:cardiolipin synthase